VVTHPSEATVEPAVVAMEAPAADPRSVMWASFKEGIPTFFSCEKEKCPRPLPGAGEWPTIEELEMRYIRRVLDHCKGHRQNAARMLGISERNLYRKLKELEPVQGA
jgi:DNA-binding NtrC family response regulator